MLLLHAKNLPNIERRCEGKYQAGEENSRSRPLKHSVFSIVEVRHPQFGEEKHSKNQVDCRENDLVDHGFNLRGCVLPCAFYGSRNIAGRSGIGGHAENADKDKGDAKKVQELFLFFINFSTFLPYIAEKEKTAGLFTPCDPVLFLMIFLRFYRRDVPVIP